MAPICSRHFRPTWRNGLLSWQRQQSTTVDPAEMREFIRSEDRTYRHDHGASRGASSLSARGSGRMASGFPLNVNEGSPKPRCSLPTHQSTAKLRGFWNVPGPCPDGCSGRAQRRRSESRRARGRISLATKGAIWIGHRHPLSHLIAISVWRTSFVG